MKADSKNVLRLYAQRFVFSGIVRFLVEMLLIVLLLSSIFYTFLLYASPDHSLPFPITRILFLWFSLSLVWRSGYLWIQNAIWHEYEILAVKKSIFTAALAVFVFMAP